MNAKEVYDKIRNVNFLEKTEIIKNANNPTICRVYILFDDGRYNGSQYFYYEIECSDEDYEILKQLPHLIGIKETTHFNCKDFEWNGEFTNHIFLKDCGLIW